MPLRRELDTGQYRRFRTPSGLAALRLLDFPGLVQVCGTDLAVRDAEPELIDHADCRSGPVKPVLRRVAGRLDMTGQAGYTLVEMMVVVSLLTMIFGITTSMMILGQRTTSGTAIRLDDGSQAEVAIQAISKSLRTAVLPTSLFNGTATCTPVCGTAVTAANTASISFYANTGNSEAGPSKVSYVVTRDPADGSGQLVETAQSPDAGSTPNYTYNNASTVRTRTLARDVLWPSPTIFTYYQFDGSALATPGADATSLGKIDSVDVVFQVRRPNGYGVAPTTVTSRVAMPNADTVQPNPTP